MKDRCCQTYCVEIGIEPVFASVGLECSALALVEVATDKSHRHVLDARRRLVVGWTEEYIEQVAVFRYE